MAKQKQRNYGNISWAQAFRDIGIHAINKGQFLTFILMVIAIIIFLRMPEPDISSFLGRFLNFLISYYAWGYILFLLTVIIFIIYTKSVRRNFSREIERVSRERTKYQEKATGLKFESSDKQ